MKRDIDVLSIRNITIKSEAQALVNDVSLDVSEGQIVALLGPNGAGKSELVAGIAGIMPLTTGVVSVGNNVVSGTGLQAIRAAGIAAVPEGHQVLGGLSVIDNLRAAGPHLSPRERQAEVLKAREVFPELVALEQQTAGSLSGGQQQMVAIAQALVSRPKFLLIDEMSLGLAPIIINRLMDVIKMLRVKGVGILLIEQFTQLALAVADDCYVLSQGQMTYHGSPDELNANPSILERAYLGD